jgi:ligand-binding sensor domain-containing protein
VFGIAKLRRPEWPLKFRIRVAVTGGLVVLLFSGAALCFVRWRAEKALRLSTREVAAERNLDFSVRPLQASDARFDWISAPAVFTRAAEFQGRLYLCGPSGLYEYSDEGKLEREFHPGRELPSSPLGRIAPAMLTDTGKPELVIATRSEGLLAFDGTRFRQILPADAGARQITAILPLASGQLLIGTASRGVLLYDGERLGPLHSTLAGIHVTELAGSLTDLWIGTLDRGVLHWHGGQTDAFTEAEGLPDPEVLSLYVCDDAVFVGTALGVTEFREGKFTRVIGRGLFAQALGTSGDALLVGTMDQGVVRVALSSRTSHAGIASGTRAMPDVRQIFAASSGELYALSRQGLYELGGRSGENREVLAASDASLTDANISALALDANGALWVGYFDRGLDILPSDFSSADAGVRTNANAGRTRHIENDRVFCVNRIVPLPGGAGETPATDSSDAHGVRAIARLASLSASPAAPAGIAVATANGLIVFDSDGNERQILSHAEGLIADHVTDVAPSPDGLAVATPAGITFLGADGARSLYAFQGLVNNHVYSLGASGHTLLAGTLGGISVLDRGAVVASYTTANSHLPHNWISAVAPLDHSWMVGTYGGGIVRLDESSGFHAYDVATGDFDVNPNAMLATDRHVFAGSLDRGLFVYDRAADRWWHVTAGLPSENVTALATRGGYIYIGTDNGLVRAREGDLQP